MMSLEYTLLRIPAILIAITIHEYAHGWIAFLCGDPTAKQSGRLSLNPVAHLDIFGTLMMFFGPFGWAKPVPINPYNFKNRRRDTIFVSAAGPASNIVCAILFGIIYRIVVTYHVPILYGPYFIFFLQIGFLLNIGFSFFNLIPVPPLDGSNIVIGFLSQKNIGIYLRYVRHVPVIFLILIMAEWALHIPVFSRIFDPVFKPYLDFWQFVVFQQNVLM